MVFETKIKELTSKRNMSLKTLSEVSGISVSTIRGMMIDSERNVRINTILKLCRGLSIDLHEFFEN